MARGKQSSTMVGVGVLLLGSCFFKAPALAQSSLGTTSCPEASLSPRIRDSTCGLSALEQRELQALFTRAQQAKRVELAVALAPRLQNESIETLSLREFRSMELGPLGILVSVAVADHKNRIELGTEARELLSEQEAQTLLRSVFRDTARRTGVNAAVLATTQAIVEELEHPAHAKPETTNTHSSASG